MNKKGLGRGLGALLAGNYEDASRESVAEIGVTEIVPNRFQPRREFDPERLAELSESIKNYGILQPIVVRRLETGYELIAGERRLRASQLAGFKTIPALIRDFSDLEMTAVALVENLQREDLNPIEESYAYRRLIDEFGFTQEEVAQKVGKSRPFIANSVRLLNLPRVVQDFVSCGTLTPGQVRPLLILPTPEMQEEAAKKIIDRALNSREAEELAKEWGKKTEPEKRSQKVTRPATEEKELEGMLSKLLGTRVRVTGKEDGKGLITIEYYTTEDLRRIIECLDSGAVSNAGDERRGRKMPFLV